MSKINIFVSQRIDQNSYLVDTDIYKPIRCGAVYDKSNKQNIPGDDTGENLSNLRMALGEFTVQYWAWKNVEADYYGLCHYRRYLSFSKKHFRHTFYGNIVVEPILTKRAAKKFGLLNSAKIKNIVEKYDIVTSEKTYIPDIENCFGNLKTVKDLWSIRIGEFFDKQSFEMLLEAIKQIRPDMYESANKYFCGFYHRGYNCFVMKKEIFVKLCDFEFSILEYLHQNLPEKSRNLYVRTEGYLGEILYGIYMENLIQSNKYKVLELQLVYFEDAHEYYGIEKYVATIKAYTRQLLWTMVDGVFPYQSKRRKILKKLIPYKRK